jgi:terminase large subunit-like protein
MKILLKDPQWTVFNCDQRFRMVVAGRRFGKTYLALTELIRGAAGPGRLAWYVAPTIKQGRRISWKPLKEMTRPYWAAKPNETDLRIDLVWGGTICVRGADNYDSLRGDGLDFLVLDEFASMAPEAWTEVLRPALADKQGRALFIGTPHGRNHFFDLYEAAKERPNWATFQYTTEEGGNVTQEELESATHEMDERTYRQEFQARFESLGVGRAYYAFERENNVRPLGYDPRVPLFWAIDFNNNPLCSVIGQMDNGRVHVLDELILPDSNTPAACEEFLARTRKWTIAPELPAPPPDTGQQGEELCMELSRQLQPRPLNVYVYGDATGSQVRTSASRTDWQIIKNLFGRYQDLYHVCFRVPDANPPVKDRINCVNALLHNQAGEYRLLVHPGCKHLIRDLEEVCWKADPHGNLLADLDKSDPMRTHASDALGYCLSREFPMRGQRGERPGPAIL